MSGPAIQAGPDIEKVPGRYPNRTGASALLTPIPRRFPEALATTRKASLTGHIDPPTNQGNTGKPIRPIPGSLSAGGEKSIPAVRPSRFSSSPS